MFHFPDHMAHVEARTVSKLLTAILTLSPVPLFVRVYDGEEWATEWTRDRKTIQQATAATDETRYFLAATETEQGGAMRRVGSILLIHGNGEDVISDASFSPRFEDAETLVNALCDHANA